MNPCLKCKEHCCIGEYGTFVTLGDIKRISKFTKLTPDKFAKYDDICSDPEEQKELMKEHDHSYFEYTDKGRVPQLKSNKKGECIFFKDKKCEIYSVRPLICRIFPIGFRKEKDGTRIFIEEEDKYCKITKKNSLNHILDILNMTGAEAAALIKQFLDEIEEFKKKIPELEKKSLTEVI